MLCYNMFLKCGGECIKILSGRETERERERERVPVELRGNQREDHLFSSPYQFPFSSFSCVIVNLAPLLNDSVGLPDQKIWYSKH